MWKRIRSRRQPQPTTLEVGDGTFSGTAIERQPSDGIPIPDRTRSADAGKLSDNAGPQSSSTSGQLLERDTPSTISHQQHKPPQDGQDDPLGLTVLYAPTSTQPSVDIVFIHGLGGKSLRTWCKNRDLDYLWPQHWLPREPEFANARVLTFGYHAHFSKKEQVSLSINDFANDLLFRLKYDDSSLRDVPIIFVAHSLGGLVFKKAFIHGNLNVEYREVTSRIKAVLFLGTPHRGSDLAQALSRVLKSSVFGHSQKEYVNELARNSPTIDEINDSFRHHARKLRIFSFYETVATAVGLLTMMIVDKASSVLGYENEVQQALIANHHDVCKFPSPQDSNYRAVCGALKNVVGNISLDTTNAVVDLDVLRSWLGVTGPPEEDLLLLQSMRAAGTCEHLYQGEKFTHWKKLDKPGVLWVHAPPGSGKSVHCSSMVEKLMEEGAGVAYWFFKYEDGNKRSVGNMLRSAAYQIAENVPAFRRELLDLARTRNQVIRAEAAVVWRTLFEQHLHAADKPHYLVVDGLDEADSARTFIDLISRIGCINCGLRLMVFSRDLSPIAQGFRRAKKSVSILELSLSNTLVDIRRVATGEMEYFISDDDVFKSEIIDEVTSRSQGNFLWATLVLKEISSCLRHEDVRAAMREIPDGMDRMYDRMAESIANLSRPADKELCRILLLWALHSQRPVTVSELQGPYATQLRAVIDIKHTIDQICGQFMLVDQHGHIVLVHQTAHEYLRTTRILPFSLDLEGAHEEILSLCLQALCDVSIRNNIRRGGTLPFVGYASKAWGFHLERCPVKSDAVFNMLCRFFSDIYPMIWIQLLAISENLSLLVSISSLITRYVGARREVDASKSPTSSRAEDLTLFETWATDFLKVVAKYGRHLADDPESIFSHIPALCPRNSAVSRICRNKTANSVSISGITNTDWNDCTARVSLESGTAQHIAVSSKYVAVAGESGLGTIQLWDTIIFQEYKILVTGEPICGISFSRSGSLFACFGPDTTHVWKITDRTLAAKVPNYSCLSDGHQFRHPRPYDRIAALEFAPDERSIIIATRSKGVYQLALEKAQPEWVECLPNLVKENSVDAWPSLPSFISLSGDCTQLAVSYSNSPLEVWARDPPELITKCRRPPKEGLAINETWDVVTRSVWHPVSGCILGIYKNGKLFKWDPMNDSHEEHEPDNTPFGIECSPSGNIFATTTGRLVTIYDYVEMLPVYKLEAQSNFMGFTFSPDGERLYDIQDASCNIWEPGCMTIPADKRLRGLKRREGATDSDTACGIIRRVGLGVDYERDAAEAPTVSNARDSTRSPIVRVSLSQGDCKIVAFSHEDTTVVVKDLAGGCITYEAHRRVITSSLVLSHDGKYLAFYAPGQITVRDVDLGAVTPQDQARVIHYEKTGVGWGFVRQLLFQVGGQLLLVASSVGTRIFDMASGKIIATRDALGSREIQYPMWSVHPNDPEKLLAFGGEGAREYYWENLQPVRTSETIQRGGNSSLDVEFEDLVASIQPCFYPGLTLAVLRKDPWKPPKRPSFAIFQQRPGNSQPDGNMVITEEITIPKRFVQRIMHPVGILEDGRLVFLDTYLWVCTLPLLSTESRAAPTRHFFIPRDWVNNSEISQFSMFKDGTIVFPSRGELGVIRNDIVKGL